MAKKNTLLCRSIDEKQAQIDSLQKELEQARLSQKQAEQALEEEVKKWEGHTVKESIGVIRSVGEALSYIGMVMVDSYPSLNSEDWRQNHQKSIKALLASADHLSAAARLLKEKGYIVI